MAVSGSSISWAICKYAPRSRQITTPAHHHSVFLQAGCPSCRPTNSVRALKAEIIELMTTNNRLYYKYHIPLTMNTNRKKILWLVREIVLVYHLRFHMWVLPPRKLCPTTSALWLILKFQKLRKSHYFSRAFNIC